jgi:zinc-ribbon domain
MYCPSCGKENSAEQKFCRSCGLSLEKAVQSLVEQLPALELDKNVRERQERVDRLINIVAGTGASIIAVGVLWGIIYKLIIVKGAVISGLFFLAIIVGAILFGLLSIYSESLRKAAGKRQLQPPPTKVSDTAELPPSSQMEPVPSVTERTTELLTVAKKDQ